MSNKPIQMQKLRQIIRLYCQGTGLKTIHSMVGTSRNTIKKYIRTLGTLGLSYDEFSSKSDSELSQLFAARPTSTKDNHRQEELEAMLPDLLRKLKKKGVTREMLHKYLVKHPDGYARSRFNNYLNMHGHLSRPVMHLDHKSDDKMYVDFAGSKLQVTEADGTECNLTARSNEGSIRIKCTALRLLILSRSIKICSLQARPAQARATWRRLLAIRPAKRVTG